MRILLLALVVAGLTGCIDAQGTDTPPRSTPAPDADVLTAAFVVVDGVYNSELMAPYDVLQHSVFRDSTRYIRPFVVSPDGEAITTFEGITVVPHHSFADAPPADILVIPSTETSMSADLDNTALMDWLADAVDRAQWVVTICDGAFPLAATGALDGRHATTFPADRAAFAERFPNVKVDFDARIVVDGKFITSVGGAMSYEPAFYLVEHLYGKAHADRSAEGLVWPWDLAAVPHRIVAR